MASKYIILQTHEGERAILFPGDAYYHDEIADHFSDTPVVAAGFVEMTDTGNLRCFGRSEGLGIESRGLDDEIIIYHQLAKK